MTKKASGSAQFSAKPFFWRYSVATMFIRKKVSQNKNLTRVQIVETYKVGKMLTGLRNRRITSFCFRRFWRGSGFRFLVCNMTGDVLYKYR
jgi:hypothetical protein